MINSSGNTGVGYLLYLKQLWLSEFLYVDKMQQAVLLSSESCLLVLCRWQIHVCTTLSDMPRTAW